VGGWRLAAQQVGRGAATAGLYAPPPADESPLSVNGEEPCPLAVQRVRDAGGADAAMPPPVASGGTAAAAGAGPRARRGAAQQAQAQAQTPLAPLTARSWGPQVPAIRVLDLDAVGRFGAGFCRMPVVPGGRKPSSTFEVEGMPGLPLCGGTFPC